MSGAYAAIRESAPSRQLQVVAVLAFLVQIIAPILVERKKDEKEET
jgi:hypothetical protein